MENNLNPSIVPEETRLESEHDIIDLNQIHNNQLFKIQRIQYRCKSLRIFLKSLPYTLIITSITIFILFSDQIRNLAFQKKDDFSFDIMQLVIMGIYFMEIIFSCISLENYPFSFFFWLDLISTITIIMDVNIFTDSISLSSSSNQNSNISKFANQSQASRTATRTLRLVRLIRLIRLVKLYKAAVRTKQINENINKQKIKQKKKLSESQKVQSNQLPILNQQENQIKQTTQLRDPAITQVAKSVKNTLTSTNNANILFDSEQLDKIETKQSKLSQILSDSTIKKVIIVILLIMFIVPLFEPASYLDANGSMDFFLSNLSNLLQNPSVSLDDIIGFSNSIISDHITQITPIYYFSSPFNQLPYYYNTNFQAMRSVDTMASIKMINMTRIMSIRPTLTINQSNAQSQLIAILNIKTLNNYTSYFSIGQILFICILLIILISFFTNDTNILIIEPIQCMIQKVKSMALNPSSATNDLVQYSQYETALVHNAIMKISSLLSIVFGNAGAQIIGTNMMREGQMNPLTKGKKKCAIYGFCDIRNFTDATQVLQEDIMVFVNQIGQIVHSSVYRYGGSANKNIGDAFLLVWKIPEDKYKVSKNNSITWIEEQYVQILSDFALLSFVKIIVKINKEPNILRYRKDFRLLQRLGLDYQVRMGFGLHIGWSIQGAIGSQYKIDASYLSPNVNMASRLQAATKQYGVPILISSALYDRLTLQMKQFCRNIDIVTVKGSNQPIGLYTVDLDLENISPPADKNKKYHNIQQIPDIEFKRQLNLQFLHEKISKYDAYSFIQSKKQLREVMMTNLNSQDFKSKFQIGFQNYINGNWSMAVKYFNQAMKFKDDNPTKALLEYILQHIQEGQAPTNWKNYRELTQK